MKKIEERPPKKRKTINFGSYFTKALTGRPVHTSTAKQMDMQIGYTFPKTSSLHGLSFTAQAQNILNSAYADSQNSNGLPTSTLANGQALPQAYEKYGRTYMIGFGYKF